MKKKIFIIALAACLAVLSVAGSSIAYFTDKEEYTNVFTAGNVAITLTAANETVDGTLLEQTNKVYPGLTIEKNVTITNTGTEDAYVAAIITLTDGDGNLTTVINKTGDTNDQIPLAITEFLTNLGANGYEYTIVDIKDGETVIGYKIYLIKTAMLVAGAAPTVVFEDIVIPTSWNHEEVNAFKDVKISVEAYATQTQGFAQANDAVYAIKAAFPDQFGDITFN